MTPKEAIETLSKLHPDLDVEGFRLTDGGIKIERYVEKFGVAFWAFFGALWSLPICAAVIELFKK